MNFLITLIILTNFCFTVVSNLGNSKATNYLNYFLNYF